MNNRMRHSTVILAILIVLAGCGGSTEENTSGADQSQSPTISLSANPTTVSPDGSTSLTWSSTNTTSCTASGGWSGSKSTSGSETIDSLTVDSTFSLSCSGSEGTIEASVSVTVVDDLVVTVNLTANPSTVSLNGTTTLTWDSTNATRCTASGDWSGSKATSGEETLNSLTETGTYILSCSGEQGTARDTATVTIDNPTAAVAVNLAADPTTVPLNGTTSLTWDSSNATRCTASGDWSGSKDLSGTETIDNLTADSQFVLTCSDANGSVSDSVDVTIVANGTGTALLSWIPPTENTDNSALTDLACYKIYYGTASNSYTEVVTIDNPGLTSYQIDNLTKGDWYFVITAFSDSDLESSYSNELSKTIN